MTITSQRLQVRLFCEIAHLVLDNEVSFGQVLYLLTLTNVIPILLLTENVLVIVFRNRGRHGKHCFQETDSIVQRAHYRRLTRRKVEVRSKLPFFAYKT